MRLLQPLKKPDDLFPGHSSVETGLKTKVQPLPSTAIISNCQDPPIASAERKPSATYIRESDCEVVKSSRITGQTAMSAIRADVIAGALITGAERICRVINLVTSITSQTNFLALQVRRGDRALPVKTSHCG
jgi:hypothetical protein